MFLAGEFGNALRADQLAFEFPHILRLAAEDTGRGVLFEHDLVAVNKDLDGIPFVDIQRAARFYYIQQQCFGGRLRSPTFGYAAVRAPKFNLLRIEETLSEAHVRLARVYVECLPYSEIIKRYDKPTTFFYCDPPYYKTENYYMGGGFGRADHKRLADLLCGIKGKFLLSYNDCEEIRELYDRPGILIEGISRLSNLAQRYENGKEYPELLISNYDTSEFLNSCVQISLFKNYTNQFIGERKIINDRLN